MFLEVPVQGQRAKIFHNGQEASTSAVQTVEFKEGWYKVTTASGNCYVGQVQPQQQPVVSGATIYHQTPQQPQQAYQPQQTVTAPPAPYQPLQYPVRKKTTVCGVCILIALALIVAFIARALFRAVENSISAGTSKQTATGNSSSPSAESADKPDFEVVDFSLETGEYGNEHIVGTAKNNTDNSYSYVQVDFNLYDSSGAQVGSTFANCNNVEPHATWKFDAPVLEDNATSAKFVGGSHIE